MSSAVNPSRVQTCAECQAPATDGSDAKIGCPNGCLVHHDCWRVRCVRGRDAFLRQVRCGICWEIVELDNGMKRRLYYSVSDDEAPEARKPRTVVPLASRVAKRSMMDDDADDFQAAKHMRVMSIVSPVTASMQLLAVISPPANEHKRSAEVDLLSDAMKRARI